MDSIVFEALHEGVEPPARATALSAGYDLRAWFASESITVWQGTSSAVRTLTVPAGERTLTLAPLERAIIPLGFRATLPAGIEGQIRARSGVALKRGLIVPNAPGTIDPDYTGEWGVLLLNAAATDVSIVHGERIAQLILARFETATFAAGLVVARTERAGGFGSTGAH